LKTFNVFPDLVAGIIRELIHDPIPFLSSYGPLPREGVV